MHHRYNCLAQQDRASDRGHGDAWFRQGRRTDRREPRNAVPPRQSERQADNCQHFLRSRCLVSETSSRSPLRGPGRALLAELRPADRPVGGPKMNRPGESEERVGARLVPRDPKSPTTLVDAIREQALDGEFDPPPSPHDDEAARASLLARGGRGSPGRREAPYRTEPLTEQRHFSSARSFLATSAASPSAYFVLIQSIGPCPGENSRSPFRRGTTCACTCGTLWLMRVFSATSDPSAPSAGPKARESRCVRPKNEPKSELGSSSSVSTCSRVMTSV